MSSSPGRYARASAPLHDAVAFPFRVEEWSSDGVHLLACHAGSSHYDAALAAYREIVRALPHRFITFRHGARVIEKHEPR